MINKILIYLLCFTSTSVFAGEIIKNSGYTKFKKQQTVHSSETVYIKNALNKKIRMGKYEIVLTRIDDRMNRIHLRSTPRNKSLNVVAYDRSGKQMKIERMGNNLSTPSTSNHKYMYKSLPEYIVIKKIVDK